ncbi:MAG: GcrA family cell cycle regulator [Pseudomonadota bacterium]
MSTPTTWTDERVKTLRELWEGGATAAQIADAFGGVSRNAVMGKIKRLGLKRPARPKAAAAKPAKRARDDEGRLAPLPLPDDAPDGLEPLCVPYAQRRPNQCCEIIGDAAADDLRCCGLPVVDHQRQICAGHLARNYKPNDPEKHERFIRKVVALRRVA